MLEKYLETLEEFNEEIFELKTTYAFIYKGIKNSFPSKICNDIIDLYCFNDNSKKNHYVFSFRFLLLLSHIKEENNKKFKQCVWSV